MLLTEILGWERQKERKKHAENSKSKPNDWNAMIVAEKRVRSTKRKKRTIKRYLASCCNCDAPLVHPYSRIILCSCSFFSVPLAFGNFLYICRQMIKYISLCRRWFWRTQLHQIIYYRCCNEVIFHSNAFRGQNSISIDFYSCVCVRARAPLYWPASENLINNRTLSQLLWCSFINLFAFDECECERVCVRLCRLKIQNDNHNTRNKRLIITKNWIKIISYCELICCLVIRINLTTIFKMEWLPHEHKKQQRMGNCVMKMEKQTKNIAIKSKRNDVALYWIRISCVYK